MACGHSRRRAATATRPHVQSVQPAGGPCVRRRRLTCAAGTDTVRYVTAATPTASADGVALPPGPRWPRAWQTAAWISRPGPFLQRCRARYGDVFTVRIAGETWVFLSDP